MFGGISPNGLNDRGQVVGVSDTTGDQSFHAFLWQHGHITDLGTVPGDAFSYAVTISNSGMVLGISISGDFNPRAALWRNGTAIDMNTLVPKTQLSSRVRMLHQRERRDHRICGFEEQPQ
jgi:probable HAF family extracellular repeat protein